MNEILGGIYYAHSGARSDHADWQSLQSHGYKVGEIAAAFAAAFGAEQIARYTGQLHDLGKYTPEFNAHLHGGPRVDHATAGAKIAIGKLMAFCIAGHHAGLANGNGEGDNRRTLKDRLALRFGADIPVLDNLWQQEIKLPETLSTPPLKAGAHHLFSPTHSSPTCSIPS
jgi:CRISPR-associated endonuclease cas3-HD